MNRTIDQRDSGLYKQAAAILTGHLLQPGLSDIISHVYSQSGGVYVCAGAVRDSLYSVIIDRPLRPRDFDIGVAGLSSNEFFNIGRVFGARQNRYGGYTIQFGNGIKTDVWQLQETVGIKVHRCRPTIDNVLRTFILDVNSAAFEPKTGSFHDLGALPALQRRSIGLVRSALVHNECQFAARALLLAARFSFRLSANADQFVKNHLTESALEERLARHGASVDSGG